MDAKGLIRDGNLTEARKVLTDDVKNSPGDVKKRTLLFQVLAFFGEWAKAEQHLDVILSQDKTAKTGVESYKGIMKAERERTAFSKHGKEPAILPDTPAYAKDYLLACKRVQEQKIEEATELFDSIENQRTEISGTMNGKDFVGFKDTDIYFSFFLEAIVHERYVWIPFENIIEAVISPPKTLFDLLWTQALVTTRKGLTLNCYLPVLYPDSFLHEDDRVKLGRMTDWISLGGPFSKGMGQHVFEVDGEEMSILEIREAKFHFPDGTGSDK